MSMLVVKCVVVIGMRSESEKRLIRRVSRSLLIVVRMMVIGLLILLIVGAWCGVPTWFLDPCTIGGCGLSAHLHIRCRSKTMGE